MLSVILHGYPRKRKHIEKFRGKGTENIWKSRSSKKISFWASQFVLFTRHYKLINKWRRMAGQVACIDVPEMNKRILVGKSMRKRYLEDLGVDGMIILKRILKEYEGDVDWSHLTQKRNQRSSLLSTITKTEVPQNAGYIRTSRATFLLSRTLLYGVSCFSEDEMNSVKIVLHWEIGNTALHLGAWKHRPLLCSGNVPTLRGAL